MNATDKTSSGGEMDLGGGFFSIGMEGGGVRMTNEKCQSFKVSMPMPPEGRRESAPISSPS